MRKWNHLFTLTGLLMAALFLTCYNLWAKGFVSAALEQIFPELPAAETPAPRPEDIQEAVTPGYLLNPDHRGDGWAGIYWRAGHSRPKFGAAGLRSRPIWMI